MSVVSLGSWRRPARVSALESNHIKACLSLTLCVSVCVYVGSARKMRRGPVLTNEGNKIDSEAVISAGHAG